MNTSHLVPGALPAIAVGYLRRSTDRQEQSIPDQRRALERYAADHGLTIARFYTDDAISGTSASRRPAFQEMIADAGRVPSPFSHVVVYDVKRFGRLGNDESGYYRHILRTHGVDVLYVSENFSGDGTDDLLRPVKQWQAREESKDLSKVTIRGLLSKVPGGWWMGGTPPFGYDLRYQNDRPPNGEFLFVLRYMPDGTKLMLDAQSTIMRTLERDESIVISKRDAARLVPSTPERVATIERIFRMSVEENRGLRAIAAVLNAEGISTARGPGYADRYSGTWTATGIRSILANPVYVGDMVWNRRTEAKFHRISAGHAVERRGLIARHMVDNPESDWIRIEDAHPALVTRRLFDLARAARETRPSPERARGQQVSGGWKGSRARFLLSGLIKCARCKGRYEGVSRRKGKLRHDGSVVLTHYYGCGTYVRHRRSTCIFGPIDRDEFEAAVTSAIVSYYEPLLQGDVEASLSALVTAGHSVESQEIVAERAKLLAEQARLKKVVANIFANIDPENRAIANEHVRDLNSQRDALTGRLDGLKKFDMNTDQVRTIVRAAWELMANLSGVLRLGTPEARITLVRKCISSIVLDSEARTAVLGLYRVPGGNMRIGIEERTITIPQPSRQGRRPPSARVEAIAP